MPKNMRHPEVALSKTCSVEKEFFEDMRLVVAEFRSN